MIQLIQSCTLPGAAYLPCFFSGSPEGFALWEPGEIHDVQRQEIHSAGVDNCFAGFRAGRPATHHR
jgi:hypothetical protein